MSRFAVGDVVVMADGRYTVRSFSWFGDLVNLWLEGDDGRAFTVPEAWLPDPESRLPEFRPGDAVRCLRGAMEGRIGVVYGVFGLACDVCFVNAEVPVLRGVNLADLTPVTLVERPDRDKAVDEMTRAMDNLASWPDRRAVAQALYDLLFGAG